ncbi:hypothetical protein NSTC731_05922 [Nostoc sp. DSM 114167]|jgi:hypothetical protein
MLLRWLNLNLKMPKFLCWALLLKTALVYFQQEQFLIFKKKEFRSQVVAEPVLSVAVGAASRREGCSRGESE